MNIQIEPNTNLSKSVFALIVVTCKELKKRLTQTINDRLSKNEMEKTEQPTAQPNQRDIELLSEIYDLLNDKEMAVDAEKQARYSQLHAEAEKRGLI